MILTPAPARWARDPNPSILSFGLSGAHHILVLGDDSDPSEATFMLMGKQENQSIVKPESSAHIWRKSGTREHLERENIRD